MGVSQSTPLYELTPASGLAANAGNNTVVTPAAGKRLRVSYLSVNPEAVVEAAFRFGAAGALFLRNIVPGKAIVAKDCGDMRFIQGAVGEPLIVNLSAAVPTLWNAFYQEV